MSCDEAIVLVGGLGTRLRPLVSDVPKPLASVAGRPFLAWLLGRLGDQGICRVILAAGYLAGKVQQAFGDEWQGLSIAYSIEDEPLGTGGAIAQALKLRSGDAMHVLNGDTFLAYRPQALEAATCASGRAIGMALAHVPDVARYGAVVLDEGRVSAFLEKGEHGPGHINAGSYFLRADAIARFPQSGSFSFEQTVLSERVAADDVFGFTQTDGFIDIGVPDDYLKAQTFIAGFA
ncbi:MAG: NTP transferase domain-containing protein [Lysobacter sp.]|nr:NTP transferase domain-containing protein [Lysobacter sp.]